ncbi:MAG TPA: mechanosensitive ion channel domain-containing protein [Syntrophorhabdaceae bacterium]|jgi:MscS family membrane protein
MRAMARFAAFIIFFAVLASASGAQGILQSKTLKTGDNARPSEISSDPLGRTTPQGTIVGFMMAARKGDYEKALKYLDTRKAGRGANKLVDELQVVLERGFSGLGILSTKAEGRLDDNLPPSKELVGTIETGSNSLDVTLERVQRGNEPPVWLFASETLAKIPEFYDALGAKLFERYFPKFMTDIVVLWFPLWQWLYILLMAPLSILVATLVTRLVTPLFLILIRKIAKTGDEDHVMTLTGPLRIFILALAIWAISFFSRSVLISLFWTYAALTLTVAGITWLAVRVIDVVVRLKHRQWTATASGRLAMIELLGKLSKALTVIAGFLIILYFAGVNITAALTGLGIGGIAIALAAQKTLENLFGGIMIISDRPIRVGDFCKAGAYMGSVESIGLRSTYLRTPERTMVSIPNGQLATMSLENFAFRDKIVFHHTINLQPGIASPRIADFLSGIRQILMEHPKVEESSMRANLLRISDSSLVIDVFAYILESGYETFLAIQEELLLSIVSFAEKTGSPLAFPTALNWAAALKGPAEGEDEKKKSDT